MDELIKYECKKFSIQLFNWLKSKYANSVYDYTVLEDKNTVFLKIRMNITKVDYEKKGMQIVNYILHTFRFPQNIYVNWRYNRNMFNISVLCGNSNLEIEKTGE